MQFNLTTTATFIRTEESGHCREVLNKSQCMDFLLTGTTKVAVSTGLTVVKNCELDLS